jgi:hypothetical protein
VINRVGKLEDKLTDAGLAYVLKVYDITEAELKAASELKKYLAQRYVTKTFQQEDKAGFCFALSVLRQELETGLADFDQDEISYRAKLAELFSKAGIDQTRLQQTAISTVLNYLIGEHVTIDDLVALDRQIYEKASTK